MSEFNFRDFRKKLLVKLKDRSMKYGEQWLKASRVTAPLGYTDNLKSGLQVDYKEGEGLKLSHEWEGSLLHETKPFLHVPKKMVGRVAWWHYGYEFLKNRGRNITLDDTSKVWLYYLGLNWAKKKRYPSYTWHYAKEAFNTLGGITNFRKTLETGNIPQYNENYSDNSGSFINHIRSVTSTRV